MDKNEEEQATIILAKMFADLLENKENAISMLIKSMERNLKVSKGLTGTLERFEDNNTPEHRDRQLKTCIKFLQETTELNSQLSLICLAYVSGGNMESDIYSILNNLGFGHLAMQYMLKKKMG